MFDIPSNSKNKSSDRKVQWPSKYGPISAYLQTINFAVIRQFIQIGSEVGISVDTAIGTNVSNGPKITILPSSCIEVSQVATVRNSASHCKGNGFIQTLALSANQFS